MEYLTNSKILKWMITSPSIDEDSEHSELKKGNWSKVLREPQTASV